MKIEVKIELPRTYGKYRLCKISFNMVGVGALDDPKNQSQPAARKGLRKILLYIVGTGVLDCPQKTIYTHRI